VYDTTIVSAVCASDVRAARGRASLLPSGSNTLACPAYETSEQEDWDQDEEEDEGGEESNELRHALEGPRSFGPDMLTQ